MNTTWNNDGVNFGLSLKKDGSMKGDRVRQLSFLREVFGDRKVIVSAELVHGNRVSVVDDILSDSIISKCDALISNDRNKVLSLTVADCLPIYFFDRKKGVIALAHAGWRGIITAIAKEVISSFITNYNSKPEDILVYIGPHIKACHFEVQADVSSQFLADDIIRRDARSYLDLAEVLKRQLLEVGVDKNNIELSEDCTYCLKNEYFSYRRDRPEELETMLAYLSLK